jgi:hypothetical protein
MGITTDSWKPRQDRIIPADTTAAGVVARIIRGVLNVTESTATPASSTPVAVNSRYA